jgi:voltage-gated potassium channel
MYKKIKRKVYEILIDEEHDSVASKAVNLFILALILLNITLIALSSIGDLFLRFSPFFLFFEALTIIVFTVEYFLRIWACNEASDYKGAVMGRIRYALRPMMVIDLFAILPFYILIFTPLDLRFMMTGRLFRMMRVFRFGGFRQVIKMLKRVFKAKARELVLTFAIALIIIVFSAFVIYFTEHGSQPENFPSIPASLWWSVITLTTVGYGDIYPVTILGRIFASIVALLGVAIIFVPAGIISSGMLNEITSKNKKNKSCPHCGKPIEEDEIKQDGLDL